MWRIHVETGSSRVAETIAGTAQIPIRRKEGTWESPVHENGVCYTDVVQWGLTSVHIKVERKNKKVCVCVCCFVLLYQYWGIIKVPVSFLFRGPRVAGSSPSTLTTSLATPVPFLFERTHHYYVDNQGLVPWQLRRVGRSSVRLASLARVLSDGMISWARWSRSVKFSTSHNLSKATLVFLKKNEGKKRKPEGETPALLAIRATEPGYRRIYTPLGVWIMSLQTPESGLGVSLAPKGWTNRL